jgi:drug/metabolite transporter (DMT)-like permease
MLPYLWMLCGSLSFAVMGTLAHALGSTFDWQVIALARTAMALTFAATLAVLAHVRFVFLRPRTLWVRSIAGSMSLICTFYALTRMPVSDVLTLTNMFPIWIGILSWPVLGERPSARVWLAVVCGVAGVVLIQQPHLAEGNFASMVALLSSFFTAVSMMGLHRLQHVDFRSVVVHFSGVSLIACICSLFLFERSVEPPLEIDMQSLLMLLGVGLSATIGQLLLTKAFALGSPAKVSVVALTQIVFVMLIEIVVWQRTFNPTTLLGMSLVLAPTAWVMAYQ